MREILIMQFHKKELLPALKSYDFINLCKYIPMFTYALLFLCIIFLFFLVVDQNTKILLAVVDFSCPYGTWKEFK